MYCFNCGREVRDDSRFCKYCGTNLIEDEEPEAHEAGESGGADVDAIAGEAVDADVEQGSQAFFVISRVALFVASVLALYFILNFIRN